MEEPRKAFLIKLDGKDTRNPVINQWMDRTGSGNVSALVRDVLYRYIVGLLVPYQPQITFPVYLEGIHNEKTWPIILKIRATNEHRAKEQALEFMQDNYPDYSWHIRNGASQ